MKQFSKLLLVVLGSAVLVLGLSLLPSQKAEGKGGATPVEVTNTPLPVSVANTANVNIASSTTLPVSVSSMPGVNITNNSLPVTVSGTPDVNITNSSPVPVTLSGAVDLTSGSSVVVDNATDASSGNPVPLITRDADNPGTHALQVNLCKDIGTSSFCSGSNVLSTFTVPAGERFVIQFASGYCFNSGGNYTQEGVQTTVGGTSTYHEFLLRTMTGSNFTTVSQVVKIYADPSSRVNMSVNQTTDMVFGSCFLGLSGYTVAYTAPAS